MIRFAWLQSRTQTMAVAAALVALAVAATITGVQLSHLYSSLIGHCQANCDVAAHQFLSHERVLQQVLNPLAQIAPALLGLFWGAPLIAREMETGTYRLAWTQSVPRSRWAATKLGLGGLAAVTICGLLTLVITWWYRAVDVVDTSQYAVFDRRDIVPIGYAAFAFTSGALLGAVIRRTVPAMATTLAVFVSVRMATNFWLRPHLLPPVRKTMSLLGADQFNFVSSNGSPLTIDAQGSGPPNSWTLSSELLTNSGHVASSAQRAAFLHHYCPHVALPPSGMPGHRAANGPSPAAFEACRAQAVRVFHLVVTYEPANRYWTLQWLETGVFVLLALICAAACYWRVVRLTK